MIISCPPSGVVPLPMGLTKDGPQTLAQSSAWQRVVGWILHASYPATVQSGDGIALVPGNYAFTTHIQWGSVFTGNLQESRLVDSLGVEVPSTYRGTVNVNPMDHSGTISWPGGTIYLEARSDNSTSTRRLIGGGANCNITFTPI